MSLFPAYSEAESSEKRPLKDVAKEEEPRAGESWLQNPSFSSDTVPVKIKSKAAADNSIDLKHPEATDYYRRKKSKHKKLRTDKHIRTKLRHEEPETTRTNERNNFYEDKSSERGNLLVPTLPRSHVPVYHIIRRYTLSGTNLKYTSKKQKHWYRYYKRVWELRHSEESISTTSADSIASTNQKEITDDRSTDICLEEQLTKQTAQYNKTLSEQPKNVDVWLKYVHFQDLMWQFEKTYKKGDVAKGVRVTAERKLSILDKALQHNPDSQLLLKERIAVAESVFAADMLSSQFRSMLDKQPGNLTLWNGYIGATQSSLALCTVPAATQLYIKAMNQLHQLRRRASAALTTSIEERILALLYDYGVFLRQAGLWELLWLLLRRYLELNLHQSDSNCFRIASSLSEELVTQSEEQILASQLPLSELWLRVEELREAAHWLPWTSDEECEDPQRLVFPDDISDLLHPITTASLAPHLATVVLTLLKVPFLPCRNSSIVCLQQKPWSLDSVEMLLPAFFPVGTVDLDCKELLKDVHHLTVGPQYLVQKLGQEPYLEFVVKVFQLCADCLVEPARTAFCVWWLRFERLLLILDRFGICKLPQTRKKKLKSIVKDFLKQDRNRNTLLFYQEYALIEKELGNFDGACKVLTTAISAQPGCLPVVSVLDQHEKASLGSLYRTLCELHLHQASLIKGDASMGKQNAVSVMMALSLGISISDIKIPSLEQLVSASEKFYHITTELMRDSCAEAIVSISEHLLPDFCVDWISCHVWLLFLTHSPWAAGALLEDVLVKLPALPVPEGASVNLRSCQREALFETYVSMLHHHCNEAHSTYSVLKDVLHRALLEFPSNLYFLTTAANVHIDVDGVGSPMWKVKQYFTSANSLMAYLFMLLVVRLRQIQQQKLNLQTHNFLEIAGPIVLDEGAKHNLKAVFNTLKKQSLTKRCPLIWRLYFRFLHEHVAEGMCKTAFYRAVEECPWVKALYIDAAKFVPEELQQVQDLIIEKELRLHVTPEELDILRAKP